MKRLLLLVLLAACSAESPVERQVATVSDSASIRIVTLEALESGPAHFHLDTARAFVLGWDESGRTFERIEDVAVLGDGRIAVIDGRGTQEIVLLTRDGQVSEVLGGQGQGPGEFSGAARLTPLGATGFLVQDSREGRATIFDGAAVASDFPLPYLDHKAILGMAGERVVFGPPLMMVMGRLYPEPWRQVGITLSRPPFEAEDTVAVVDWDQSLEFNGRDPWSASGYAVFDGQRVIYGRGDQARIEWRDLDGTVSQILRWDTPPEVVSDSAMEHWRADYLERNKGLMSPDVIRDFMERSAAQATGFIPYFDQLFVDDLGRVWLGEYLRLDEWLGGSERTYFVFSRDGESLGSVRFPSGLRVRRITSDLVVGYELGEYGEPAVVGYAIQGPEAGDGG